MIRNRLVLVNLNTIKDTYMGESGMYVCLFD